MAQDYQPINVPPAEPPKKNNTTLIVAIVVVVILLCCCCIGAVALYLYQNGDQIFGTGGAVIPRLLSMLI